MTIADDIAIKFDELTKVAAQVYTIRKGDTLGRIARYNGLTLEQLYLANPNSAPRWKKNPRGLQIGEKVNIPESAIQFGAKLKGRTVQDIIDASSKFAGIDSKLLAALIQRESGGKLDALSPAGARGLGQLMPGRIKDFKITDPNDPTQNIPATASYLAQMYRIAPGTGDEKLWNALAAYNWGPTALLKWHKMQPLDFSKMPQETQKYASSIFQSLGKSPPAHYQNWLAKQTKPTAMTTKPV
jgi:LysM repeat protein